MFEIGPTPAGSLDSDGDDVFEIGKVNESN